MYSIGDFGPAGISRAVWLSHIRQALDAADSVARQLTTCAEVAPDALALLARLDLIRGEVEALQDLAPTGPFEVCPNWIDSIGPYCS